MANTRKEAVIVVDYQNDFANPETGSLYVMDGEKIAEAINKVVAEVKEKGGLIISSRELHPKGHISFASNYIDKEPITNAFANGETPTEENFVSIKEIENLEISQKAEFSKQELKKYLANIENSTDAVWPEHCVEGEFGSEFYEKFDSSQVDIEIKKGFSPDSHPYSAFGGKTLDETKTTLEVIQEYGIKSVKIVGLATDYCNIETAMDAKKYGFEVEFITEATAGVTPEGTENAIKKMKKEGIKII